MNVTSLKRILCPCGEPASDTIRLTSNVHQWHCGSCVTQWALVQSAIKATERRGWDIRDYRTWVDQKRRAA